MIKIIFIKTFILFGFFAFAQEEYWQEKLVNPNSKFSEIQEAFYSQWGSKPYTKGKGYKQFKRWENFWENRLLDNGEFPDFSKGLDDFLNYQSSFPINDNSTTWTPVGPINYEYTDSWSPGQGRINCIAVDPNNSQIIYAGTPAGGLWKTTNGGVDWEPKSDFLSVIGISGIAINPSNSSEIYITTGDADGGDTYSIGIWKSLNGGESWIPTGFSGNQANRIIIDPFNNTVLWVASSSGLYKSENSGNTWQLYYSGNVKALELSPNNSNILYFSTNNGMFYSLDGGITINQSSGLNDDIGRICISTTSANPNLVYIVVAKSDNSFNGIYKSINNGQNFILQNNTTNIFDGSTQAWYDLAITTSDNDENFLVTGVLNLWKSIDGGLNWVPVNSWSNPEGSSYTHADIHFLDFFGDKLYCGSDGGVYVSSDNALTFSDLSKEMQIGQFYKISSSQINPNIISGGLQDNGGFYFNEQNWLVWHGADGMESLINPNDNTEIFGMIQFGNLYMTNNGIGLNSLGSPESGRWITPMQYDIINDKILAGYSQLYSFSENTGWQQISNFQFPNLISEIEIYEENSDIIYLSDGSNLYKSSDGGVNISNIQTPSNYPISSIEVSNSNPNELWITVSGWSQNNKVYHSTNAGITWENISYNLPNIPTNIIKRHHSSTNLYIGMDIGIYYLNDEFNIWMPYIDNLPNVIVNDIEINELFNEITVGTYGRGVWKASTINSSIDSVNVIIVEIDSITDNVCSNVISPELTLVNIGSTNITQLSIQYNIDNSTTNTYIWNGLAFQGDTIITQIPEIDLITSGNHIITIDVVQINNEIYNSILPATDIEFYSSIGENYIFNLTTDCWSYETSFSFTDSNGNQLFYEDMFTDETEYEYNLCFDTGCYTFTIYDTYGDGLTFGGCTGSYQMLSSTNEIVFEIDENPDFGYSATHEFCIEPQTSWNCIGDACVEISDNTGNYSNLEDCQTVCLIGECEFTNIQNNECNGNGIIEIVMDSDFTAPHEIEVFYPNGTINTFNTNNEFFYITNLNSGIYIIQVTSANGAISTGNVEIFDETIIANLSINQNYGYNILCHGACSGEIILDISQGGSLENYTIDVVSSSAITESSANVVTNSNGNLNNIIFDELCADNYQIVINSSSGCQTLLVQEINQPEQLSISAIITPTSCSNQSNGEIDISVSGGIGQTLLENGEFGEILPYYYSWSNGANTQDISSLETGNYYLTVSDDVGCSLSQTYQLDDEISSIEIFSQNNVYVSSQSQHETQYICSGSENVQYLVTDQNLQYNWTVNYDGNISSLDNENYINVDWSNLSIGTYINAIELLVYDPTTNCTRQFFLDIEITESPQITLIADPQDVCIGDTVSLSVISDTQNYYSWNLPSINDNGGDVTPLEDIEVIVYAFNDAAGCTTSLGANINVHSIPEIEVSFDQNVFCVDNDITIQATEGLESYDWTPNYIEGSSSIINFSNGGEYNFSVNVTDENGCHNSSSESITVFDQTPIDIYSNSDEICLGESIELLAGTNNYFTDLIWTLPINSTQNPLSYTPNHISDNVFDVEAIDVNGCSSSNSITIEVSPQPQADINFDVTEICLGDSVLVSVAPSYVTFSNYSWYPNEIQGSSSYYSPSNSNDNEFSVTVTNEIGCQKTIEKSIVIIESPDIDLSVDNNSICLGESITLSVSSQSDVVSYNWFQPIQSNENTATYTPNSLNDNMFGLEVQNSDGCISSAIISIEIEPLPEIGVEYSNITCLGANDGQATVFSSPGFSNYNVQWLDESNQSISLTSTVSNLNVGDYQVILTNNNNGCSNLDSIVINESDVLKINNPLDTIFVSCFGNDDASHTFDASGGVAPYNFSWNDPLNQLSETAYVLASEQWYTCTITDANNCNVYDSIYVDEPTPLEVFLTHPPTAAYCDNNTNGFNSGSASVYATGGTPNSDNNYNFIWSTNGQTNENVQYSSIDNLNAGTYQVTVLDNNLCTASLDVNIDLVPTWQTNINSSPASCYSYFDGSASIQMEGGCGDTINSCTFSFSWLGFTSQTESYTNSDSINNLQQGYYDVVVQDEWGCQGIYGIEVDGPSQVEFQITALTDQTCYSASSASEDGSVDVNIFGGEAPYTINWIQNSEVQGTQQSQGQSSIYGLSSGDWQIGITDNAECQGFFNLNSQFTNPFTISEGIEINDDLNDIMSFPATSLESCDGMAIIETSSTQEPYEYYWNGIPSENLSYLCAGFNYLTTIDAYGCTIIDTVFIGPENYGCMDSTACNYDQTVNIQDNSCIYPMPYLDCASNCINDTDNDGICDELEVYGCTDSNAINFNVEATEDNGSCIICNLEIEYVNSNTSDPASCNGVIGIIIANSTSDYTLWVNNNVQTSNYHLNTCYGENSIYVEDEQGCSIADVVFMDANMFYGCTDSIALNYDSTATEDNNSCEYAPEPGPCDITPSGLFVDDIIHERVRFNWDAPSASPHHYMIRYRAVGTTSWTVMSAGPINTNDFNGTSRTRYFMEPGTTYQWNIRARMLNEDLSIDCQSAWSASSEYTTLPACANLENLSVVTEATWVDFFADAPAAEWGVWDSKGKLREVGSNNYRYVTGGADGIDFRKGNFNPSTNYEWHTKAWCTANVDENGDSDPAYHSGWGDFSTFTTEAPCDKMPTNLTTSTNGNNTAVVMNWDTPESGAPDHYFLELTNETTTQTFQWNNISGEATSKVKYNQSPGNLVSWKIRGACGAIGTSWATIFTQEVSYTLGGAREAMNNTANINVYPNPSRGIFKVNMQDEKMKKVKISISNYLGKTIYVENIEAENSSFSKEIDLSHQTSGIYIMSISSNNQSHYEKIVID